MTVVQTVVETKAFLAAAKSAGMTETERTAVIDMVASNPQAGDVVVGTGGCRKLRFAGRGKGKSGGYRVVTAYGGERFPVFLLTVFGKGDAANLTRAERNELGKLTHTLFATYGDRIQALRKGVAP